MGFVPEDKLDGCGTEIMLFKELEDGFNRCAIDMVFEVDWFDNVLVLAEYGV